MMIKRERYEALDGLRLIAAMTVIAFHIEAYGFNSRVLDHGYLAVDLFFVLSGFVIGAAYEKRMIAGLHPIRFMFEVRLIRLYPMILLGIALGLLFELANPRHVSPSWIIAVEGLTFIPDFKNRLPLYPIDTMEWSLAFELLANLFHAIVLRRFRIKGLVVTLTVSAIGLIYAAVHFRSLDIGVQFNNAWGGIPRVLFSYTAGLLIWRIYDAKKLPVIRVPWPVISLLFFCVVALPFRTKTPPGMLQDLFASLVMFPLILSLAVQAELKGSIAKIAAYGGAISYPLYALQEPLISITSSVTALLPKAVRTSLWGVFVVVLFILAASALRFYDEPFRKRLMNFARIRFRTPAATAP